MLRWSLIFVSLFAACGGQSSAGPTCSRLCQGHGGCGRTVDDCTSRCDALLSELACEDERAAMYECFAGQPASEIACGDLHGYTSFSLRSAGSSLCQDESMRR